MKLGPVQHHTEKEYEAAFARRREIRKEIADLEFEAAKIEECVGLDEMKFKDTIDGTNMIEYTCARCENTFGGVRKGICPICRPYKEES